MTTAFCELPCAGLDAVPEHAVAAVIGAGSALGAAHQGAENGPFFVRTLSKSYTWSADAPGVFDLRAGRALLEGAVDVGDLEFDGMTLDETLAAVKAAVGALPTAVIPCVIGGDHTITLAVVDALSARRSAPITVVQFDHHLDLQIWESAPARADASREPIFNTNVMSHVSDRIGPQRLIQIGVAPYATVESDAVAVMAAFLASVGQQVSLLSATLDDREAMAAIFGHGRDVYLTVDVDVLDPAAMSSTGCPADIGLGTRELLSLVDLVLSRNRLIGFDLVEFAAHRDARDPKTLADAGRATLVFLHLLGWACRSGRAVPEATMPTHDSRAEGPLARGRGDG